MKKRAALFLTVSLLFVIVGNYMFFSKDTSEKESVVVARAIDGDTVELADGRTVRLININTPEKKERGYAEAKAFLAQYENQTMNLDVRGTEKYGRTLGALYDGSHYINLEIIRRGFAHMLLVDDADAALFARTEQEARDRGEGIWEHSPSYDCLDAEIDKKAEYVLFTSECTSTRGWVIQDETTHGYHVTFEMPLSFTLYSAQGTDTDEAKYWGRGNVWNDNRDTLFVRDANGLLVFALQYGY